MKSVSVDPKVKIIIDEIIHHKRNRFGLIVGYNLNNKFFIVHVLECPDILDEADDSEKLTELEKLRSLLDDVIRLLPGGLNILGAFSTSTENQLQVKFVQYNAKLFSNGNLSLVDWREENKAFEYLEFTSTLNLQLNLNKKEKTYKQVKTWLKNFNPKFLVDGQNERGLITKSTNIVKELDILTKMSEECISNHSSLRGYVKLRAILPMLKNLTYEHVFEALCQDANRTVMARINILIENEQIDNKFESCEGHCVPLPRRAMFSINSSSVRFSTYLCVGENESDIPSAVNGVIAGENIVEAEINLEKLEILNDSQFEEAKIKTVKGSETGKLYVSDNQKSISASAFYHRLLHIKIILSNKGKMNLEREVSDCGFSFVLKLRVSPASEETSEQTKKRLNLVATSKYGLIFVACEKGLKTLETKDVVSRSQELNKAAFSTLVEDIQFKHVLEFSSTPVHVSLNANQTILSVVVAKNNFYFALLFDVHSFAKDAKNLPQPFVEAKLSDEPNEELMDLAWNPGLEMFNQFAYCLSSGRCRIMEILKGDDIKIISSLTDKENCTCLCWSPKGKQLVVGKMNGTLTQYDCQFTLKRHLDKSPMFSDPVKSITDVLWVSTYCFFAAYESLSEQNNEISIVLINAPKNQNLQYIDYKDVCFNLSDTRMGKYYFRQIASWNGLILAMSAGGSDVALLGKSTDQKNWEKYRFEDNFRAETPLSSANSDDTFPIGMDLDFTSTEKFLLDKGVEHPAVPIVTILTTDWVLTTFRIFYENQPSIVQQEELLESSKARKIKSLDLASSSSINPVLSNYSSASLPVFNETKKIDSVKSATHTTAQESQKQAIQPLGEATYAPNRSPAVARTLKFGDSRNEVIHPQTTSLPTKTTRKSTETNNALQTKFKIFQCELSECNKKIHKIYDDVMNSPINVVTTDRMNNLLTKIDDTNDFITDFKKKIKKQKQIMEDFDMEYQQNITSYKYITWKVENYQSPKILEQMSLRPLEPVLKQKWVEVQSKEWDIRQKIETLHSIVSTKESLDKNKTKTIHSDLIISTLASHRKTIDTFKLQLDNLAKDFERFIVRHAVRNNLENKELKREKHKLMKNSLISRKINKVECLSQSTFTLAETSIKLNKLQESEIIKTANNSALESSRDAQFGAPVAHSTPFVKTDDGKKGKIFGSSATFIKPQPTLGQNLPKPNLSTFRVTIKEDSKPLNADQMKTFSNVIPIKVKEAELKEASDGSSIPNPNQITTDQKSVSNIQKEKPQQSSQIASVFKTDKLETVNITDSCFKLPTAVSTQSKVMLEPNTLSAESKNEDLALKTADSDFKFSVPRKPDSNPPLNSAENSNIKSGAPVTGSLFSSKINPSVIQKTLADNSSAFTFTTTSSTSMSSLVSATNAPISKPTQNIETSKSETKVPSFSFPHSTQLLFKTKADAMIATSSTDVNTSTFDQKTAFSLPKSTEALFNPSNNIGSISTVVGETTKTSMGIASTDQKPLFSTAITSSSSVFGSQISAAPFSSHQTRNNTFGSGGFMSGLGKPNQLNENNTNVFGTTNFPNTGSQSNIFDSKPTVSTSTFGGGQFTSGSTNVAKSGFGDFAMTSNSGAFGSTSTFGSSPAFGGGPTFGGSSGLAGLSSNTNTTIFGSSTASTGFGAIASSSTPTFGNLAQQGSLFDSSKPTGVSFTAYRS
ncbi:DgyrCDS8487 [Dimorphilus gyrociliatus]|uniref:DgyrCDS8487 n=1 Tax=Dimorphilus gyrociliatus TaxID=2664684 RepID=A0A7I8VVB6_9ANNE|nr:DgyrCDS8487 [Dimorphilus gyrociliatus]